jgi:hypothetical protein
MDIQALTALEKSIEPYRRAGFIITSQSEGAITLVYPREKFSYLFFIITFLLLWPVAIIYLISYNNQNAKTVCVRITSEGDVEESGYTFGVMQKERKRRRTLALIFALGILFLILLFLLSRFR